MSDKKRKFTFPCNDWHRTKLKAKWGCWSVPRECLCHCSTADDIAKKSGNNKVKVLFCIWRFKSLKASTPPLKANYTQQIPITIHKRCWVLRCIITGCPHQFIHDKWEKSKCPSSQHFCADIRKEYHQRVSLCQGDEEGENPWTMEVLMDTLKCWW